MIRAGIARMHAGHADVVGNQWPGRQFPRVEPAVIERNELQHGRLPLIGTMVIAAFEDAAGVTQIWRSADES